MIARPTPVIRRLNALVLNGTMAVYQDQAEASEKIPGQWRDLLAMPLTAIQDAETMYGASPCTGDHKIHYLCGVADDAPPSQPGWQQLVLPAGEYAIFVVNDDTSRGETWGWILNEWLPASEYKERPAPEFERFTKARGSREFEPSVELGVPVEPRARVPAEKED